MEELRFALREVNLTVVDLSETQDHYREVVPTGKVVVVMLSKEQRAQKVARANEINAELAQLVDEVVTLSAECSGHEVDLDEPGLTAPNYMLGESNPRVLYFFMRSVLGEGELGWDRDSVLDTITTAVDALVEDNTGRIVARN